MPEIVNAITARNYELIRDRIANILAIELPSQAILNSDVDLNPTIEIERFVPVKDTELPLVNVMLLRGDYDSYTTIQQGGSYMYHVDIYTKSKWSDDDRADKLAFMKLQRLTGVIQAILSDSKYSTLGFAPPSLSRVQVNSIKFADPANNKDASSSVMARLEFEVRVPETVEIATLILIGGYDTSVIMGNTAQGYIFSGNNAPIPPPICANGFANIKDTDGNLINFLTVPSGTTVPYNVANSEITFGTHTFSILATDTLNVPIVDTDGNSVSTTLVGGEAVVDDLPCVQTKTIELLIYYSTGDASVSITIFTDSEGTITTADTTGLTSVTYTVNGTSETLPITLIANDLVVVSFDPAASDGEIKLTGTYV